MSKKKFFKSTVSAVTDQDLPKAMREAKDGDIFIIDHKKIAGGQYETISATIRRTVST